MKKHIATALSSTSMQRRQLLLAGLAAAAGAHGHAWASTSAWPTKPVRLIVPFPPGGTTDAAARLIAEHMGPTLGQPLVVENRPGAGGVTGMDVLAKANDGHTICFAPISPLTLLPYLSSAPYNAQKDFAPLGSVMYTPVYILATTAFTGKTFEDVLTQARARPGKLSIGTPGLGTLGSLMVEQIKRNAKVDLLHVPYKGDSQLIADAVGAHFDLLTINPSPNLNGLITQGKLRILAVTGPARLPSLPQTPTLAELNLPQANMTSRFGMYAPANTPPELVQRLNTEINRILALKNVQEQLTSRDNVIAPMSPAQFEELLKKEAATNERIIREAGIRLES
ncbi:Bug family tripartite tricarboxylate transporter substrate binding protein [Comamonas composti]|uniref:Bug family tripartite tricarboxylate transporter substrate binding protein n=1 Tax=Comamonas composti TaxID=408558 RepID=UPI00041EDE78|nr:tripartite tricarboxylate transporter substrate binding protein [Comamonas composti]